MRLSLFLAAACVAAGFVTPARAAVPACDGTFSTWGNNACYVPATGTYLITATGAQGGNGADGGTGGLGAAVSAVFTLDAYTVLYLDIGQAGADGTGPYGAGGGGGGTFVFNSSYFALLLVAGGGGGASGLGEDGLPGLDTLLGGGVGGSQTAGAGGAGATSSGGGGGANTSGTGATAAGGTSRVGGLAGGAGVGTPTGAPSMIDVASCTPSNGPDIPTTTNTLGGAGGYGGGGGGGTIGGGGGGYSGGNAAVDPVVSTWSSWSTCNASGQQYRTRTLTYSAPGGGGGSYIDSLDALSIDQSLVGGAHSGDGTITITPYTVSTAVPEPASLALFAAGLALLPLARRRRQG